MRFRVSNRWSSAVQVIQSCLCNTIDLFSSVRTWYVGRVVSSVFRRLKAFSTVTRSSCILIRCTFRSHWRLRSSLKFWRRFLLLNVDLRCMLSRLVCHNSLISLVGCGSSIKIISSSYEIYSQLLARIWTILIWNSGLIRIQISTFNAARSVVKVGMLLCYWHGMFRCWLFRL